jgi:hypothetical protein
MSDDDGRLFDPDLKPRARHTDPDTSHGAAVQATPRAGTNRRLALTMLRAHPEGLTDFELATLTGIPQTSIGVRRGELRNAGLVQPTTERRKTPNGGLAIVWMAVT